MFSSAFIIKLYTESELDWIIDTLTQRRETLKQAQVMPENRVLRGILEPKSVEVTIRWRKLHNQEMHIFLLFTKYY
jgi:hypothetical protein